MIRWFSPGGCLASTYFLLKGTFYPGLEEIKYSILWSILPIELYNFFSTSYATFDNIS